MSDIDDIVKEFLVESYENLDRLDRDFVALETDPTSAERLGSIFRTIHTIKGTCGFLGFSKLETVAHVAENLLSRLRDGQLRIDTQITTGLLNAVDSIREILAFIEGNKGEGDKDYSAVVDQLRRLNESGPAGGEQQIETATVSSPAPLQIPPVVPEAVAVENQPKQAAADKVAAPDAPDTSAKDANAKESAPNSLAANAIRVDVGLLDKLMTLVGELVLARNQVLQFSCTQKDAAFLSTTQRLNLITTELQESVMKTRMQPIGNLWDKFPRIVRDVAQSCHKKVRIEMEGRDTELDKTILEAIKDPLTHIIRNSVDHGVESPQDRLTAGKAEEGCIFMRAFHEGGQVNIEISDDGKGIDPEKVKRKAIEKGLITADRAARMNDRDAVALIFLPGFSTAEKVTNVSGRGVGMDVVKTNVEKIGGTVDFKSRPGQGSTVCIKIPLTLAIIPALVVTSNGERFAIPQVNLLELVRLDTNALGVEAIHNAPVFRLRESLLPLVYLSGVLKLPSRPPTQDSTASANIVVLQAGGQQFGLVVDQITDTEEIVVKPLAKQVNNTNVFAGATIMGDGRVALILDVIGFAQKANVITHDSSHESREAERTTSTGMEKQTLLLFKSQDEQRMAVPLSLVARLEEFPRKMIEKSGNQNVVQYRGQIMPLINLSHVLKDRRKVSRNPRGTTKSDKSDAVQVVVYLHENQNVGIRVEKILDVVEEAVEFQEVATRAGVSGTAIIRGKVTEILDIKLLVETALRPTSARAA